MLYIYHCVISHEAGSHDAYIVRSVIVDLWIPAPHPSRCSAVHQFRLIIYLHIIIVSTKL